MIQASGLTADSVLHCTSLLRKDPLVAHSFGKVTKLVDDLIYLIVIEMDSLSKDIVYWNNLLHSSPMYVKAIHYYISIPRSFRKSAYNLISRSATEEDFRSPLTWSAFVTGDVEIEDRLLVLRKQFFTLTKLLASVYEACGDLKYIYLSVLSKSLQADHAEGPVEEECSKHCVVIAREYLLRSLAKVLTQFGKHPAVLLAQQQGSQKASHEAPVDPSSPSQISPRLRQISFDDIAAMLPSPSKLTKSLRERTNSVLELLKPSNALETDEEYNGILTSSVYDMAGLNEYDKATLCAKIAADNRSLRTQIRALSSLVRSFQQTRDEYPLRSLSMNTRKPKFWELYWLPNVIGCVAAILLIRRGSVMYSNGELQALSLKFRDWFRTNWTEHMIEPMQELVGELFDTMSRKKEAIVTRADLVHSKIALNRMLDNFSKSTKGSSVLSKVLGEIQSTGTPNNMTSDANSSGGQISAEKLANQEQIMEALMRRYEEEMQSPVQGFLFGNLVTSMLIQVGNRYI
jgi:hypothetical protein